MLCNRCQQLPVKPGPRRRAPAAASAASPRLERLICEWCGGILPVADPTDTMLEKLSQLARFGLNAEGKPLFQAVRPSSR